jgi:hypothetical protein
MSYVGPAGPVYRSCTCLLFLHLSTVPASNTYPQITQITQIKNNR